MKTFVICCGMRRSGGTLTYHYAREILQNRANLIDAGWVIWQRFDEIYNKYHHGEGCVILKTHPYLPAHSARAREVLKAGKMRAIYTYRDVRDVAASLIWFHESNRKVAKPPPDGGLRDPTTLGNEIRSLLEVDNKWRRLKKKDCLVIRYEKMMRNHPYTVRRIADFVGQSVSIERSREIANIFSLERQRERQPPHKYDGVNLLWPHHIRDGKVGEFRESLSSERSAVVLVAGSWLKTNGYIE